MPYVRVGESRLFVDVRGARSSPAVLYLHGGPGMSCYAFMMWQGQRLSRSCQVVGLDQRGVLRSDPLGEGERLTEERLVEDCEAIREALEIPRWTVIGHSYGGRIALRYACAHPDRVAAVIFENPAWDLDETERLRLPAAAAIFDELGKHERAERCRRMAARAERLTDWRESLELVGELDDHGRYNDLYVHQPESWPAWHAAELSTAFPDEQVARAQRHAEQAMDGAMEPLVGLLGEVRVPATLITGEFDLVTGPRQVAAFRESVPGGRVREFAGCGHFVQLEAAEEYAGLVIGLAGSASPGAR